MSDFHDDRMMERIERDLDALEHRLSDYVLKAIFEAAKENLDQRLRPLERVVYGLVGLVLIAVATAVIALVITGR